MSQFPDISDYIKKDASCQQAEELYKGRNLARVLRNIYLAIPECQSKIKEEFAKKMDHFLKNDVSYKAPEVFSFYVWPTACNKVISIIQPDQHPHDQWRRHCADILVGKAFS